MDMNSSLMRRATDQIACDMGGEVVILDLKSGNYYGLDAVGARVWTLIEEPRSLADIRRTIMDEYEVDADTCERDIIAFIDQMQAVGIVEICRGSTV
jgi:Coenzyme PQQ synthesis protein D (PqqD)